ncbi:MAG: sigma-54 dependent transcriptional regulator [Myxococcota bacterium]|nr:sigma-54 dependent transcriptional regulator [Myxococcota bacterium]
MSDSSHILVVDDERSMREFLEIFFRREGHLVTTAGGVEEARSCLEADDVDIVISDMQMPDGSGLDVLHSAQAENAETPVVMITAFATTDSAIAAMKDGAYDYITKPFKVDELALVVGNALEKRRLTSENRRLRTELRSQVKQRSMTGNSAAMQRVFDMVAQVADTKTNVLVSGESGTGKELVARAIHDQSERSASAFVAVNCGAIPENLLESELFGHVKGAFTGAVQNKEGLFETAENGTLFLDEIGELSMALQVKLLRAIQEKSIRRVGGTGNREVNVRIISATNRLLEEEVAAGRFREDLYYRLNVIQISLPPLRDRKEDIPLLVNRFVGRFAAELGKEIEEVTPEAMGTLSNYAYPGNVRELENAIERAVALCRGSSIDVDLMPPTLLRPVEADIAPSIPEGGVQLDTLLAEYERALIGEALRQGGGVKKRAAKLLGVSFRSLRYRLEKLDLARPDDELD